MTLLRIAIEAFFIGSGIFAIWAIVSTVREYMDRHGG